MNAQYEGKSGEKPPGFRGQTPPPMPANLLKLRYQAKSLGQTLRCWLQANSIAPQWLPRPLRHLAVGYIAVLLLESLAVFGSFLLIQWCPEFAFKSLLPVLGVILISLTWGAWPGLLAMLWGAVLLDYMILPPAIAWDNGGGNDVVSLLLFLAVGVITCLIAGQIHLTRQRTEKMTQSLREEQIRTERERLRLRTLFDVLPAPVGMVDAQGQFLERTPACKTLWGEGAPVPHEIADYEKAKAWWPDTGQPLAVKDWGLTRALTRGEVITNAEVEIEAADGQRKIVRDSATPIRDEVGAIIGAVGILQDVTELKRLEEALRLSEREAASRANQLEAVFEAMTEAVLVFDTHEKILQRNAADRRLFIFDTEPETLPERRQMIRLRSEHEHPVPFDRLFSIRSLKGELVNDPGAPDVMVTTSQGDQLLNVTAAPIRDAEGHISGGVLVMRDVTERRKLEQHTRQNLDALLSMAEALVQVHEEARHDSLHSQQPLRPQINPMLAMVTQRLAELILRVLGCQFVSIAAVEPETEMLTPIAVVGLSSDHEQQWRAKWDEPFYLGEHFPPDFLAALHAGEPIPLDGIQLPLPFWQHLTPEHKSFIVPMRVGENLVGMLRISCGAGSENFPCTDKQALIRAVAKLGALVLERERLLRERAEAQASALAFRDANARMDTFLGMAGHELKTPLTSIKLSLQLTERRFQQLSQREPDITRKLAPFLEQSLRAESHVERLERLINDLLDVSRIRAGKLELRLEPIDLAAIVREAVEEQRQAAPGRRIIAQIPADLRVPVTADADRIGQVVTNYLTNALKYSQDDRPVEIDIAIGDRHARVWVRDNGPGLPPEELDSIWERFHRARGIEVQSGSGIGLGLGLHICQTIIERHQGQVGVESAVGQGSTFWFTVPLAAV